MLDNAVQQVRALSYDLNPSVVERAGLQSALDRLVGRFRGQFAGSIRYLYDSSVRVPLPVGNAWYKIAELALENAIQHSGATRIEVHVRRTQKNVMIEVRDNGKGFSLVEAKVNPQGLGLLLIEHYASLTADCRGHKECSRKREYQCAALISRRTAGVMRLMSGTRDGASGIAE